MNSVDFAVQAENVFRNTVYAVPHTYLCFLAALAVNLVAHQIFKNHLSTLGSTILTLASFGAGLALSLYVFPASTGLVALTGSQALQWGIGTAIIPLCQPFFPGVVVSFFGPVALYWTGGVSAALGALLGRVAAFGISQAQSSSLARA